MAFSRPFSKREIALTLKPLKHLTVNFQMLHGNNSGRKEYIFPHLVGFISNCIEVLFVVYAVGGTTC